MHAQDREPGQACASMGHETRLYPLVFKQTHLYNIAASILLSLVLRDPKAPLGALAPHPDAPLGRLANFPKAAARGCR